jgi:beta-lactamase regulating signal transducer with metallopeptidase domain/protocatechuate 3,4-dioxygenase beta subunit
MFRLHLPAGFPTTWLAPWAMIALLSLAVCGIGLLLERRIRRGNLPLSHAILLIAMLTTLAAPLVLAGSWLTNWSSVHLVPVAADTDMPTRNSTAAPQLPDDTLRTNWEASVTTGASRAEFAPGPSPELNSLPSPGKVTSDYEAMAVISQDPDRAADSFRNDGMPELSYAWKGTQIVQWGLIATWVSGAIYHLFCLFWGLIRVRQFEQSIQPETDSQLLRITSLLSRRLGMSHCPPLGRSRGVDVPVSLGLFRSHVILPDPTGDKPWSAEDWGPLLAHELAHIHRRDHIVGLIQRLTESVYWWNPLVHVASRELSVVREQICDDLATSITMQSEPSGRREYAARLLDLAERATSRAANRRGMVSALAAWNGPGDDLARRIQHLIDPGREVATSLGRFGRIAIGGFVLGMITLVMAFNVRVDRLLASDSEPQEPGVVAASEHAVDSVEAAKATSAEGNEDEQSFPWLGKEVLVLNQDDEPIAGATVTPWGTTTHNASMMWTDGFQSAAPIAYTTNERGIARLEFPKYVVARERIAPRALICRVEHTEYAPRNVESILVEDETVSEITTIRMTPGAQVEIEPLLDGRNVSGGQLYVDWNARSHNPRLSAAVIGDGTVRLLRCLPGTEMFRVVFENNEGQRYFSSVQQVELVEGQELRLTVDLEPGVEVRGKLSDTVPRPVINGRVVAVSCSAEASAASLAWYSHAIVDEEGNFSLDPAPRGLLQVIALCEGYMAQSGSPPLGANEQERDSWGQVSRPQIFPVENATHEIQVEMIPTATARIQLAGPNEQPISQAQVGFSPNVAWWRGGSQLYGFPLISSWEMLVNPQEPFWQWNDSPFSALTNDDGVAVIKNLPPGVQMLFVSHDEFQLSTNQPSSLARFEQVELSSIEECQIALVLEPRVGRTLGESASMTENVYCGPGVSHISKPRPKVTIPTESSETELAGVVIDVEGRPLAGVKVDVWTWHPGNETMTDEEGRFRLTDLERLSEVEVEFSKPGYCPSLYPAQKTGTNDWTVVLTQDTYLEGRVLDSQGEPVPSARVRAARGPFQNPQVHIGQVWTETTTDAEGRYRLYLEPYDYDLQVRVPNVGTVRQSGLKVIRGSTQQLDLMLESGITFRARILDSMTGDPIPGIQLWNWQHSGVEGTSDENGLLEIDGMSPGEFDFMVTAEGVDRRKSSLAGNYARWWSPSAVHEHEREEPVEDGRFPRNLDGLTFSIQASEVAVEIFFESMVTITGRVIDPEGNPVEGATVAPAKTGSGNSLTGDTRYSYSTDERGEFTMFLPASRHTEYNLIAHDGEYNQWRNWAGGVTRPFQTQPGQVINDLEIRLQQGATVRGQVLDAAQRPKPFTQVRAIGTDGLDNRYYVPSTKTDEQGHYELKFIRAGEHRIQVEPFWLSPDQAPEKSTHTVTVDAGGEIDQLDFVLD